MQAAPPHTRVRLTSRRNSRDALTNPPNLEKENLYPNKTKEIAACSFIITYGMYIDVAQQEQQCRRHRTGNP
jgi:hypothetical protein